MMLKSLIISTLLGLNLMVSSALALEIPSNRLLNNPLTLKVAPGKVTAIHFENGETIQHYLLSDDTRLVFTTDAPLDQATTFMLREIEPNPIPGATQTGIPNLLITTRLPDGSTRLYEFLVDFQAQIPDRERVIRVTAPQYRLEEQKLSTNSGEISLIEVADGLNHVLRTQQASLGELKLDQVKYFLILARHQPLESALATSGVDVMILIKLGQIGLQNRLNNGKSL
ncbi:MAG: hypothetical protein AB4058_06480 [Microcystaceae cyanobacterium]